MWRRHRKRAATEDEHLAGLALYPRPAAADQSPGADRPDELPGGDPDRDAAEGGPTMSEPGAARSADIGPADTPSIDTDPAEGGLAQTLAFAAAQIDDLVAAARRIEEAVRLRSPVERSAPTLEGAQGLHRRIAAETIDELLVRLASLRIEAQALAATLARASSALSGVIPSVHRAERPEVAGPPPPDASRAARGTDWSGAETSRRLASLGDRRPISERIELLVQQMAVAGSSRLEIADRLRHDYGVDDPGPLIDDVLPEER